MKNPIEMKREVLNAVDYANAQILQAEIALQLSNVKEEFGDDIPSMVECATVTEAVAKLAVEHPENCDPKKLIRGLVAMQLAHIHTSKERETSLMDAVKKGVEEYKNTNTNEQEGN